MAIFDAMFEFSDGQDIGTSTITEAQASTNVLYFTDSDLEMGAGEPLWLNIKMGNEALLSTGSNTMTFALCRDTDSTIDGSSTVIYQSTIAKANLTAGAWVLRMPLPYNVDEDAYIGLLYTNNTAIASAGTVDAWLDLGPQSSFDTQVSSSNI